MSTAGSYKLIANDSPFYSELIKGELLLNRLTIFKKLRLEELNKNIKNYIDFYTKLKNSELEPELNYNQRQEKLKETLSLIKQLKYNIDNINNELITNIDKTHYFFLNSYYKPMVALGTEYSKTTPTTIPKLGQNVQINIPLIGNFFSDMGLYIKLSSFSAVNPINKVKYYDMLGHKLLKYVGFFLHDECIDSYDTEFYNFFYQFMLSDDKKISWKKCIGQEIAEEAFFVQDPLNQNFREKKIIYNGAQTYKNIQEEIEIFIPLLFSFCEPKNSVPNNTLLFGQNYILFSLSNAEEITTYADYALTNDGYNLPEIKQISLYTNHIFIDNSIIDLFNSKIGNKLIRTKKYQKDILTFSKERILLNKFTEPIEYLFVAFRPVENGKTGDVAGNWNKNSFLKIEHVPYPALAVVNNVLSIVSTDVVLKKTEKPVDTLGLLLNNIKIFETSPSMFYNSYLTYRFGNLNIHGKADKGTYFLNFNLNPGDQQPSGYLDVSKSRELYLEYESSKINLDNNVEMIVYGTCLNFLHIDNDNSIRLQY